MLLRCTSTVALPVVPTATPLAPPAALHHRRRTCAIAGRAVAHRLRLCASDSELELTRQPPLSALDDFELDEIDMPDDFDPNAESWVDANFVADYGWDPLGLSRVDLTIASARNKDRPFPQILRDYREAELRHGRLAMLAAIAWPVQELLSPVLSRVLREPILVTETAGRSPSVLNGGLEQSTIPATLGAFALLIAAVDVYSLRLRDERGDEWLPGDLGFDPLNVLGGSTLDERRKMQAREIDNGRLAMVAVVIMVMEEAITGRPVTQLTHGHLSPSSSSPEVQRAFDWEFAAAAFRPQ